MILKTLLIYRYQVKLESTTSIRHLNIAEHTKTTIRRHLLTYSQWATIGRRVLSYFKVCVCLLCTPQLRLFLNRNVFCSKTMQGELKELRIQWGTTYFHYVSNCCHNIGMPAILYRHFYNSSTAVTVRELKLKNANSKLLQFFSRSKLNKFVKYFIKTCKNQLKIVTQLFSLKLVMCLKVVVMTTYVYLFRYPECSGCFEVISNYSCSCGQISICGASSLCFSPRN